MIKMNKEELLPHLEALGLVLADDQSIKLKGAYRDYPIYTDSETAELVTLKVLGIEFTEEKPAITIKNLGLFMAKFGEYPEASFTSRSRRDGVRMYRGYLKALVDSGFEDESGESWSVCEIIDDGWTAENLKEGEV